MVQTLLYMVQTIALKNNHNQKKNKYKADAGEKTHKNKTDKSEKIEMEKLINAPPRPQPLCFA